MGSLCGYRRSELISLIRRACGIDESLSAFDSTIDKNFKDWIFGQNAGQSNRFTEEQMNWLRMIKDHIISSYQLNEVLVA